MRPNESGVSRRRLRRLVSRLALSLAVVLTVGLSLLVGVADAQDTEPAPDATEDPAPEVDPAVLEQLQEGAQVYSQICSSCHQPGGLGLSGQFPPLLDNPNVDDTAYVERVIDNGLQGEIVVAGQTYNGVMPSFGTLSDEETDAVIAYIQNDFQVPVGAEQAVGPTGPVAGTELPALTNMGAIVAYLLAAAVAGLVLAPRLLSTNDRLNVPWLDVGLKTAVITFAFIFLTVIVPDWALKTTRVSKLDRVVQDIIGVSLWGAGFLAVLWALWFAHRESRI